MSVDLTDFKEVIGEPGRTHYGPRCWHYKLSPERQAQVDEAHKAGYSFTEISTVMAKKWDIRVGEKTIGQHYRKGCSCERR